MIELLRFGPSPGAADRCLRPAKPDRPGSKECAEVYWWCTASLRGIGLRQGGAVAAIRYTDRKLRCHWAVGYRNSLHLDGEGRREIGIAPGEVLKRVRLEEIGRNARKGSRF
jgi:hypothetical protein